MEHKYDVFISYSRKDIEEVTQLVDMLKKRIPTLDCWFDITGIECGDEEFDEKIVKIIDNSSYVLFALSKNSMESKWAKDEVMYAKNVGKKVIPVLLDGAKLEGWFLFKFGRVDCIDSTKDIQIDKMMKNISEWTKKPILKKEEVEQHEGENVKKIISDVKHPTPNPSYTKYILGALVVALGIIVGIWQKSDKGTISGHDYVDLGLPSGLKWATCNVGANTPEEYGDYFAWGETNPKWEYTKENSETWNISIGNISGKELYDVAKVKLGKGWRIPTEYEAQELVDRCTWIPTVQNGVSGTKVVGPNGKSIFLPAAGYYYGNSHDSVAYNGRYWTSTPYNNRPNCAYYLYFSNGRHYVNWYRRFQGHPIRPVMD